MAKETITLNKLKALFEEDLQIHKKEEGESAKYKFSRSKLDSFLQKKFPDSSKTERSNAISNFLKSEGMYIQKIGHGQYEYFENKDLTERLIFDAISKAIEQISGAKIIVNSDDDFKKLKSLCVLADTAEKKLRNIFIELMEDASEFKNEYEKQQQNQSKFSDE